MNANIGTGSQRTDILGVMGNLIEIVESAGTVESFAQHEVISGIDVRCSRSIAVNKHDGVHDIRKSIDGFYCDFCWKPVVMPDGIEYAG